MVKRQWITWIASITLTTCGIPFLLWRRGDGFWDKIAQPGAPEPPWTSNTTSAASTSQPTASPALPSILNIPPEYLFESKDQQLCERIFGASYLKYITTHQQPYCEPESLGALQCFSAPRHPAPWHSDWQNDTLCVAQGVHFGTPNILPVADKQGVRFALQCRARNLTRDAQTSVAAAEEMRGFPELDEMPTYWFDTGIGPTFRSWHFGDRRDEAGCTKANANSQWILIARREHNTNIWHKMTEIWQARHTIDALQMSVYPTTGRPWLTAEEAAAVTVVFEDDRQEPLDHLWTVATGNTPIRMSSLEPGTCFGNVIIPLAGSSSPFWTALLEDVYHETCRTQTLLNAWVRRVFDFLKVTPRPATEVHAHPTITIVERAGTRKFISLDRWVEALKTRYPKSNITVYDFAAISLPEQLRVVQATDVFVGHHGAAMTHSVFLPPEAAVVEILPPVFPMRGFRSLARMRGLAHFGANCMWPEEWNATVNGVPLPQGWTAPKEPVGWQEAEWTYMTDEQFLGIVDAAVRNQMNKKYQYSRCAPDC